MYKRDCVSVLERLCKCIREKEETSYLSVGGGMAFKNSPLAIDRSAKVPSSRPIISNMLCGPEAIFLAPENT